MTVKGDQWAQRNDSMGSQQAQESMSRNEKFTTITNDRNKGIVGDIKKKKSIEALKSKIIAAEQKDQGVLREGRNI